MVNKRIEEIDSNFAAQKIGDDIFKFYDVTKQPFSVYGFYSAKQNNFLRMDPEVAKKANDGVYHLCFNTSGGRIRFKTDSQKIVVKSVLPSLSVMKHMPLTGSSFFDLYVDGVFTKPFYPANDFHNTLQAEKEALDGFCSVVDLKEKKMRNIEINFPLYNSVSEVYIGLDEDAKVSQGEKYVSKPPIVYYGSSITQGGCASHPGNAYPNIISRKLNRDFINLGFSGSCKAELVMAEYIATLDMSVFVYDYDYNAGTAEYLEKTHEPFYKLFRKLKPDVPIVFITVADKSFSNIEERRQIIYNTYQNAVNSGDKNVYFIDGQTMYENVGHDLCTVDNCHPNDLGFWCMANSIGNVLDDILNK